MAQVIPIPGAVNFRDFGGYATPHGRVRYGRLFRCGHLAGLTDEGRGAVLDLGLETICDLRFSQERVDDPTPLPRERPRRVEVPMDPGSAVQLRSAQRDVGLDVEARRRFMQDINRELATDHAEDYRRVFDALLETEHGGFLVHCTAGKDRTGLAAALIKRVLGVSLQDVERDYLLTNEVMDFENFVLPRLKARYPELSASQVEALSGVHSSYLEAAFAAIDEQFGSFEAFLSDGLGLTESARRELIGRYVA